MNLPDGIKEEDVKAKMAAGLSQDQAVEVLVNQQDHDAGQKKAAKKSDKPKE
jgi:hypothetical protein